MFTGISAFPLTPLLDDRVDVDAFGRLVSRLVRAGVDSIGALGSTGCYAYLDRDERKHVARTAVELAGDIPVIVGIGALRTSLVQELADDAQQVGAAAVLLAPVSYQRLTADDVLGLYQDVTANLSVPLVVYDNPTTTHFTFDDDLYAAVAGLPQVSSIKIPGVPADPVQAAERIRGLRATLPDQVTIGVSGDGCGVAGLVAGCNAWYSVIGGVIPELATGIRDAVRAGDAARASELSDRWQPVWDLMARHGSLRVAAAIAEQMQLVQHPCLPRPVLGLPDSDRSAIGSVVEALDPHP